MNEQVTNQKEHERIDAQKKRTGTKNYYWQFSFSFGAFRF